MSAKAYLLTGSNLGDRAARLQEAADRIGSLAGDILKRSPVYETPPWGFDHPIAFLNQALEVKTDHSPAELLTILLGIERSLGRTRNKGTYEARTIDIDILLYDDIILNTKDLVIPHPRMHLRRFTLKPLADIAPGIIHPVLGKNVAELLRDCRDKDTIRKPDETEYRLIEKEAGDAV